MADSPVDRRAFFTQGFRQVVAKAADAVGARLSGGDHIRPPGAISEAAFLAALPKAPNNYNPFRFPDAAKTRRDWVLDRMTDDKVVTAALAATAKAEPIVATEFRRPPPIPAGDWFAEEVRRQLIAQFGQDTATQGGLMVRTSLRSAECRTRRATSTQPRRS